MTVQKAAYVARLEPYPTETRRLMRSSGGTPISSRSSSLRSARSATLRAPSPARAGAYWPRPRAWRKRTSCSAGAPSAAGAPSTDRVRLARHWGLRKLAAQFREDGEKRERKKRQKEEMGALMQSRQAAKRNAEKQVLRPNE